MKNYLFLFITIALFSLYTNILAYIIPATDRVDWTHAGLLTNPPSPADRVFQINLMSGADWDAKLLNALTAARSASASGLWSIIYFPKGVYELHTVIQLNSTDKNIIFQGAGANKTTLKFDFGGTNQSCFRITGDPNENQTGKVYITSDL